MSPGNILDSKNSIDLLLAPELNIAPIEAINSKMTDSFMGPFEPKETQSCERCPVDNYEQNRKEIETKKTKKN